MQTCVAQSLQQGRKCFSIFETKEARKTANLPGLGGGMDNDSSGEAGGRRSGGRKHVLFGRWRSANDESGRLTHSELSVRVHGNMPNAAPWHLHICRAWAI